MFASAFAFLLRHWKAALPIAATALLAILLFIRTDQRDDARAERDQAQAETKAAIAAHDAFARRVKAKSETILRAAAENALRVERAQQQINQETSHVYQERIAAARARAERLRRERAAGAAHSGSGADAMPGAGGSAGGADAAAGDHRLSDAERLIATEQAIRLEELQNWIRRQAGIDRSAPPMEGDDDDGA